MELGAAPVSFAQQGLWYQAELEPGNPAYHVPIALRLRGAIDPEALARALKIIAARHEVLRTTFAWQGSELIQVIHPEPRLPFRVENIASEAALAARIREEIHEPFDLIRGPLLRCVLFRGSAEEAVLLTTMHHLVTDGWSMGVMVRELAACYRLAIGSSVVPLPELEIQYADFAEWQREQAGHAWADQLTYWRDRLQGPLPHAEIPTDFPRTNTRSYHGATETFPIPLSILERLKEIASESGATLFMTLLAAFKVLVYRHTHQPDVIVGSPVANRNSPEVEELVGFFVNTQVLRTDLGGNPTFAETLRRVKETTLGAWDNQDIPFEMLTSALQPERKRDPSPFFQVMFALQNAPRGSLELPGMSVQLMDVVTDTAKLALTVITEEIKDALELRMEYSRALFTRETIRRLAGRYQRLLQEICADPLGTIDQLPLLSENERSLLQDWGGGVVEIPRRNGLHRWFEEQVEKAVDRVAVRFEGQALTYQELDERANRLAHYLQSVGVGPETLVGLCLNRSLELVVGILAILKAGGAYVPLDPAYPTNRLRFVIEDSQVAVVVTHSSQDHVLKSALTGTASPARLVMVDREAAQIEAQPAQRPGIPVTPDQAAYVIYTSGSTGRPKGVVVTHGNVTRLMSATESLYDFRETDVWTLFHSYAFDFSVWEMWGALLYGGRVVVVPYETSRTPGQFMELLAAEGVTVLNQTPSAFYQLMAADEEKRPGNLTLRYVIFGGEALDIPRLKGWFDRHGDESPELINMYGITETTVHVTHRRIRISDVERGVGSVIGRPLPDLKAQVLDESRELVPIGVAGELFVGGAGVARGYLRREELTASRFVEDPRGSGRMYRTGDLVRWLGTGELEYLGRIDTQVKIRGFRIELGEIEHVLLTDGGLREVVVVARPGPSDQARLLTYGVPETGKLVTPNRLRQVCEEQLPDYMVPSAYVLLEALPLTANGKLDRDALPDPDLDLDAAHEEYVAPSSETEAKLARIWAEVLQVERVGVMDNFFALGGDSILLLQIAAKSARAGLKLSRRNLIEYQTIAELAALVKPEQPAVEPPKPIIQPEPTTQAESAEEEDFYPLTPLQQGLLFHAAYAPEQDVYIEQLHGELTGALDLAAFEKAWQTVISRHAVLRTSFVWREVDEPLQRVARTVPFRLDCDDWRELNAGQQEERLDALLAADRRRGFDPGQAPLTRFALARLSDDRWHWIWTHHHLVLDGWCLSIVIGEVLTCYEAYRQEREPVLPHRRPYRDYIDWLTQQDSEAAEGYWRKTLAGFTNPTRIEALHGDAGAETGGRGELELSLTEEQTARLHTWARHKQITINTVVTAAWANLLHAYSRTDDLVFGVTVSGRPAELVGYEDMVGPFINTLPLRVMIDGDASLEAWLRDVQHRQASLREYEFSRLVDIQRWSGLPAGEGLFETLLVFENYPVDQSLKEQTTNLTFGPVTFVERGSYPLALAAIPSDKLALRLYYDAGRFDAAAGNRILAQLCTLLTSAASDDVERVGEWSLLATEERQVLRSWNDTAAAYPADGCAHHLIEEQVERVPDRVALVMDGQQLTYRELDIRANRLAHHLRRRGVGPEGLVGLSADRSVEMIVGLLAVWKAGAAYVPIDPDQPERRISHMLEDSGVRLILTQGHLRDRFRARPVDLICLDDDWDRIACESAERPISLTGSGGLAYVIFTSGSTGRPKGTLVEHRAVCNLAHALARAFDIRPDSQVLQFASLSFDVSVSEVVMALCFGATLHLARRDEVLPGPAFAELLREKGITHLSIVPSVLASVPAISLPDLRCLIVGGEACPWNLLETWSAGRRLFNCYGPTEATVCSSLVEYAGGKLTIGRPISNVRMHILDGGGLPVPVGVPGELHLGGAGLSRGYLRRPSLTAERFVPDPFGEPGARLYKTGDLARYRSDGNIEFLGRIDHQVKIRGHRIELDEITQVMRDHCGLRDAAVLAFPGPAGQPRLVAYCVAGDDLRISSRRLRATCEEWLPEHMVPSAYILLDELPLTPTGKLDRAALPDPDLEQHAAREAFVAGSNDVETTLARVWSEVLGVERVGVDDNFFALGGDSILSLQVVSRAARAGLHITPRDVFQQPTVAALARVARGVARQMDGARESNVPAPLTPIQRWFFEQGLAHPDHWNQAVLVEVRSAIPSELLENALRAVSRHHGALRARFQRVDGRWQQHINHDDAGIAFETVALPLDREIWPALMARHTDQAHASLSLAEGPLARAVYFRGEGEAVGGYLLVVIHHMVIDGVSWRILLDDLQRLCQTTLTGAEPAPLEPATSFTDWARRLDDFARSSRMDVGYWLSLEGSDFQPLPTDGEGGATMNVAGTIQTVDLRLSREETELLLRRVPPVYHTQVNDVLLAAFFGAMHTWTGHRSLWMSLEGHGRETLIEDIDLSRTVGWFTSLFPVRLEATGIEEPGSMLRSIKEQLRRVPQNGVGFGIARYLGDDEAQQERLASLPHPEVSFNYLGQFDQPETEQGPFRLADGPLGQGQHSDERRQHLLDVVASVQSGQFRISWHYSTAVHQRSTIEGVANGLMAWLRRLIEHCLQPDVGGYTPSDFPLCRLDQPALDRVLGSGSEVEDLYGLTPMQQGLLFHGLQSREPDLYVEQLHGELRGRLDVAAFERGWREVIQRHAVFRTAFVWENLPEPLQRVEREVDFRIDREDWRSLPADQQTSRLQSFLESDRQRGLDLGRTPLFRVALIQLGDIHWQWVWTHHHILLDGWCLALVVREVLHYYEAFARGAVPLARPSRPYRDYIAWLARQDSEASQAYWKRVLAGFTTPTRLNILERSPADEKESRDDTGQVELSLTVDETRQLQAWTRRQHITLNTLVAGAWARLLQTFSGNNDVVFGVIVSGRPAGLTGSDEMIGLFINTLPVRVGSGQGAPLIDWLRAMQQQQTELREREYSRLVDIQRWSDLPAGETLFETLLAFDNYPVDHALEQRFGDLEIHDTRLVERTHYPLTLSVVPGEELRMRSLYDAGRFTGQSIGQVLECMRTLLLSAAADEVPVVDAWSLVSAEEQQSLIERSASARIAPVADECLPTWFSRVAAIHPQSVALRHGTQQLTYLELERRSNQLAHHLRARGVGVETLVGLCVERSLDLVVGILGILKAGGAYVPFDPSYPPERIAYMLQDSHICCVVTQQSMLPHLGSGAESLDVVLLDGHAETIARESIEPPAAGLAPGNAAYAIYTSGSTGRPKGCVVTHANVSRLMKQTESWYAFDESDVWTLFHSSAFDFSVWEIWGALLYGGSLVIVPYTVSRSPEQFYDLLIAEGVTVLNQTPSAFRQLMSVDEARNAGASPVRLRYVIFGGEALQPESLAGWFERHGDQTPQLVNMYGITETTVHVTYRPIRKKDLDAGSRIGVPIPDLGLFVLDNYRQLVPTGVPGELYVAGAGLSRGYLGQPALTAERMIPNPFGAGRLYKTGDLVRWRDDGLEYLGRVDEQVKVRGFRIEIGEIESVLAEHPQVREAVVVLKELGSGDKRLVAYVVWREEAATGGEADYVSTSALRSFLAVRLPDYMIPSAFVFMASMPLTANGKTNRAALPAPTGAMVAAEGYVAPRTSAERILAGIWSEVLGVETVGIHDNFFALGGDSIRSIQVLSRARAANLELSFQALFEHPTIAELAGGTGPSVVDERTLPFGLVSEAIRARLPEDIVDAYPLTRLQQGMFFYSDFESGATTYHDVMSYHLRAPYELSALHEALAVIADRHPILRTSFEFEGFEEPLQLVHRKAAIPLAETDLRGSSSDSQDEAVRDWAEHERHQPFAPDTAPLLHAHVHRRGDDDLQFSISFHHAILDGWSVASMLTELFEEYLRLLRRPLALPPPPELTFRDFVALEQRVLATPDERIFWTQFLEDAPFSPLPRWQAEREERPRSIRQQRFEISEQTSLGLKQLADDAGVPLRSVLLAAHLRAIAHIANQNDVVTGLVTNGRPEQADGDRVLGLFLNTIPFRLRLDGGTWLALVQETFRTEQQLSPHRRFPLSEIQKVCGGRSLFEVDFNFVHFHVFDQLAGLEGFESLDGQGFEETNFTLAVNFSWWGSPGRLGGGLDHDTTAIADEQARAYRDCYGEILDAMAARPEERYETRSLLSVVERRRLLVDFQSAPVPRSELALHQLITLRSEAIAVSSEDHFVPYEELQRRSNQLAQVLRRMGVGPDVLVGVGLEPGPERVVSLLAILKAGGAYVPLDPGYPRQRLALMIEDSGLSHLITKRGVLPEGLAPVGKAILVDEWTTFDGEPDAAPDVVVSPENLAYVLYTSGSTGRPKGVLITHRGIVNHMLWMQREYPLTPDDRVFQKTPFSFDASVWEFWAPLMAGASLYVGRLGGQQDPAYLVETIRAQRVTVLQVVPTLLEALLAEPGFGACRSLRRVFVGGEALSFGLRRRFHATLPATDLINLYGPTEATIDTTSHRFDRDAVERLVPIGRPISNVRTYVLDSLLNLAPLGTEGDLFIGGDGLGRGYLNRPGLTAASFVPDPFVEEPGGRLYRTGDRARWLPNGVLEFRGRADDQVKFRGYRVELGEIESALALHPAVEKAVVSAATNRLVAYLVLDRVAAEPPAAELRSFLTQRLPDHMVPSVFMILDCLPLTHSGKVDRKALPLPDGEQAAARQEYVAPASEGEVVLAAAWESVLGVRQVGVHDNFFELGGDSIMSLQIVARVRRAGWKIAPRLILQEQTIARIAARAERVAGIQPAQVLLSGDVPLSPIQRTFFDQELANPHHWNQAMLLTVPAGFAVDAFRRALRAVESHHDSLRLRFTRSAAGWQQAYADEATEAPCDVIDLSDTTSDLRAERVTREASRIQAALDISRGPVMRAAHFNFGDGHEGRLLLVLHHLVVDGVSWRILLEDLATAYEQALREQPFALPEKTASFRAWVERLQVHAASAVETFWLDLASRDVPRLPVDVPEGRDDHSESAARSFGSQLDADATRALIHDLPGRARAQITEVLLAALVESVSDWTGGDTLWLDLEGHGREDLFEGLDVSRTVGWFTSLFPLALARANGERSIALLRSVKSQLREVPANGLDFGVLRYLSTDSTLRSRLSAMPPRAISFNYLGRFDQLPAEAPFRPALESVGFDHDPAAPRQYLLDVIARVVEGRLTVEWIYAGRAFHDETIERLASAFMEKLPVLIEDALASEDVGYVPSDFPLARIDQQSLQALTAGRTDVVDLLPLSSLQEGLLFHALDEEQEGVYVQQITVRMEGHPNQLAFERAWNRTIERHAILRTSFHRADLSRPLQLVHREAACPATWLDWRALSEPERERQWATLLEQDRLDRFDFERPPLMRLTVVREGERQWRLLWTHHHLLLDGWSLPLLLREVVALYREESEGVEAALSSPPSYSTYIAWLERRDHADAESYWRSALSGFTHANEIALPPPATSVEAPYADAELRLPEDLTARLTELAQAWRVTLNTVVQGLWALLLSNYSRQPDVVFGVTVSGRPAELPGIENTVGLFINTLPLRVSVAAGDSLIEFLQQVQCRQVAMSQFEYSRLVDVQGWSEVPRGRSLFDTIVVFENYPLGESLADVPLADFAVTGVGAVEWTHYPLTCFVTPGRRLRIKLVYQTKRFDRPQIDRLLEHAHVLLAAIGKDSEKPLGALSPLTKVEREQVLLAWNDTAEEYEPARPFHERFAAQASQTPDAPAVVFEERSLNYRELDEQSNQLASTLRTLGIGPEKLVAILMDRSLEMVVALLGVLKAGGAYLPLDPRFPVERLAMMLEDGAPSVLLTQDALASRAPKVACPVIRVDSDWPRIATQSKLNVSSAVEPENLAYVIFTSGSTGRPKGVQIAHRALTNLLKTFARRPGMTSEDVMVAVTTLSFDIAGLELYLPLMCGSRLVIASAEDAADGERLAALLCGKGATVMQATPATWRLLLTTGWKPSPSLRMWCGGEAMPPDLAEALLTDGGELWNVYGPTETTIWSAIGPVRSSNDARSVGRPIGNTTLYVVDEWLNPMPIGLPGELLIGGDGLARGYRDQPALTAEKFVPDPFSSVPGARAYRTGDSVRVREDGSIEFLGRIDSQVKIRGFRVELGEIEAALRRDRDVREAVVAVRDDRQGQQRLVAYLVLETPERRPNLASELSSALRVRLPEYMVPGIYVDLAALPLTPNAKIDRKALPAPDLVAEAGRDSEFVAPRDALEEVLADLWRQTLVIDRVGVRDNFFALGGHSLHAAQIVASLRQAFQVKIPLRSLFEATSVEQLAVVLRKLDDQPDRLQRTAAALLKIKAMSPEERARRLEQRQARDQRRTS